MTTQYLEIGLRNYQVFGRKYKAHGPNCAAGFRCDREHALIYGSYQNDDGTIISVERASREWGFCAYCGIPQSAVA